MSNPPAKPPGPPKPPPPPPTSLQSATSLDDALTLALARFEQAEQSQDIATMAPSILLRILAEKNPGAAVAAPNLIAEAALTCKRFGLDPMRNHLQIVKFGNDGNANGGYGLLVGLSGYQHVGNRDPKYAYKLEIGPCQTVVIDGETGKTDTKVAGEITKTEIETGHFVASATVEVWMSEYTRRDKDGNPAALWADPPKGKPKTMLRKVAEVQLRRAVSELDLPSDIELGSDAVSRPLGIRGGVTIAGEEIPTTEGDSDNA